MRKRQGFTLIELMVAMTLTIFVMVILSDAFTKGLDTFSGLKAIGDMQEKLRVASTRIRADLSADHFTGKRRPSDPDFITNAPPEGFMAVGQVSTAIGEGTEDGVSSVRGNSWLHFTVKLRGNRPENIFQAPCSPTLYQNATNPTTNPNLTNFGIRADAMFRTQPNVYTSQWAEVAYFLIRTGTTVSPTDIGPPPAGSTPLYSLYRAQYLAVPDERGLTVPAGAGEIGLNANIACRINGANLDFFTPGEMKNGQRTFNPGNIGGLTPAAVPNGSSLLLTDVVSFRVEWLQRGGATWSDAPNGNLTTPVQALKITLRTWDRTTEQTRQVTIIQDL